MMSRDTAFACGLTGAMIVSMLTAAPAAAQDRKWEVEVHGGGLLMTAGDRGTASAPSAGTPFTTIAGRPSRRVSSWYFGDGATLLNQVNTALAAQGRITSLDPALNAQLTERSQGGSFGIRVARHLTRRFSAEFSLDYAPSDWSITSGARAAIESSRDSFIPAWNGLLATGPFLRLNVSSNSTFEEGTAASLLTTGALNFNLRTRGRFIPYVTGGAGVLSNRGDAPKVTLAGNYTFQIIGLWPINETDTVTLRGAVDDNVFVWVIGGGLRYSVAPRWDVRVDVRHHRGKQTLATILDARPTVVMGTPTGNIASFTTPSMQFSNATTPQSTFGGPAITDFRAFTGRGSQGHTSITAGLSWRF